MSTDDQLQNKLISYLEEESKLTRQVAENNAKQLEVLEVHLEHMNEALGGMRRDLNAAVTKAETLFVPRAEFEPIKKVVMGAVGMVLISVFGALIYLVVQ